MIELLQTWGALVTAFASLAAASAAWRVLGRIEGTVERWGKRLDRHSGSIREHEVMFARLSGLPDKVNILSTKIDEMREEYQNLKDKIGGGRE